MPIYGLRRAAALGLAEEARLADLANTSFRRLATSAASAPAPPRASYIRNLKRVAFPLQTDRPYLISAEGLAALGASALPSLMRPDTTNPDAPPCSYSSLPRGSVSLDIPQEMLELEVDHSLAYGPPGDVGPATI